MKTSNWMRIGCAGLLALLPLLAWGHGDEHDAKDMSDTSRAVLGAAQAQAPVMDAAAEAKAREYFTDKRVVDQDGREMRFYSDLLKGRKVLIDFIFTSCEDTCPMATAKLQQVRAGLGERFGKEVVFISISVDPERDDPAALKAFAAEHGADIPGWFFLTGAPEDLHEIARRFGQYNPDPEMHSTLMIAGDVARHHWLKIPPFDAPPQIVMKLDRLGLKM